MTRQGVRRAEVIPLLHDRPARGDVTIYVCENLACQAPAVGAEASRAAVADL